MVRHALPSGSEVVLCRRGVPLQVRLGANPAERLQHHLIYESVCDGLVGMPVLLQSQRSCCQSRVRHMRSGCSLSSGHYASRNISENIKCFLTWYLHISLPCKRFLLAEVLEIPYLDFIEVCKQTFIMTMMITNASLL
jgi:hypothetical protein